MYKEHNFEKDRISLARYNFPLLFFIKLILPFHIIFDQLNSTWDTSLGFGFVRGGGGYLQSKLHLFYFWQLNGRLNRLIVFNVIFAAVYYDVYFSFS